MWIVSTFAFLWILATSAHCSAQQLELAGQLPDGPSLAIAASADTVYQGSGGEFRILVVSPPSLTVVGEAKLPSVIDGISAVSSYAYLATWKGGLRIVDVSSPIAPVEIGFIETPGPSLGLFVDSPYVYLACDDAGLRVVDAGTPSQPQEIGNLPISSAQDVVVVGDYAYVAARNGGLFVVNVATPSSPTLTGTFSLGPTDRLYDVAVVDTVAYLAYGPSGLIILDISSPEAPTEIGSQAVANDARSVVAFSEAIVTVADGTQGVRFIDVTDPNLPSEIGWTNTPGEATEVCAMQGLIIVADTEAGARVIDASNVSNPTEVAFLDTPGWAGRVAAADGYAYVSDGSSGIRAIDVSPPSAVHQVGSLETLGPAFDMALTDSILFAVLGNTNYGIDGLIAIDIRDPGTPQIVGSVTTGDSPYGISVRGSYAYLTLTTTVRVFDITDPQNMVGMGTFVAGSEFTAMLRSIESSDSLVFVCDYLAGLRIVNVSTPSSPTQESVFSVPGIAFDVSVDRSYAYIGTSSGVTIADVRDPTAPVETGSVSTASPAIAVAPDGDYLYAALNENGVALIDVTNRHAPSVVLVEATGDGARSVSAFAGHVAVADGGDGLYLYRNTALPSAAKMPQAVGVAIQRTFPNPFNPFVTIDYDVRGRSEVSLSVFDVRGRLVRTLVQTAQGPGIFRSAWDGRGPDGTKVPSGIYFVVLRSNGSQQVRKVALLR